MGIEQRPLVEADLDQMWEIEREAFNAEPAHFDWWRRWERTIGVHRIEGLFLDGRLVAVTPEAFRALWALLGAASSVVPTVFFRGGPSDPLAGLLDGLDVAVSRERPWMLRLVDAPAALAARGYADGVRAAVPLEIADADCPWNAGRFTLVVEGGAGRLEPGGSGAIRLGVGALASLYSGYATSAALARTGRLEGGSRAERAALDGIFAGPIPWMIDEF